MMHARQSLYDSRRPPRWSIVSTAAALVFTLALFVAVPFAERLSRSNVPRRVVLRPVRALRPPPVMPPPLRRHEGTADPPSAAPPPRPLPTPAPVAPPPMLEARSALGLELPLEIPDLQVRLAPLEQLPEAAERYLESAVDEPPQLLRRIPPAYPGRARLQQVQGLVEIAFTVTADGRVERPRILRAEPAGFFEESVLAAVAQWRFTPAYRRKTPVSVRVRQILHFELK